MFSLQIYSERLVDLNDSKHISPRINVTLNVVVVAVDCFLYFFFSFIVAVLCQVKSSQVAFNKNNI